MHNLKKNLINDTIDLVSPFDYIAKAFSWSRSKEGFDFWGCYSREWQKFISKKNKV